ncbi:MAG: xylose isomerase [Hydrogenophilales bacterium CG_4_9_14_3_um_filter_63_34]|nr:MAG: xylose isomerase [Hydrogenophilales bacterium CG_4_9_14_3_um_filter_63_34]
MSQIPGRLITYCTNIHPGEGWREVFAALQQHIPAVKAAVSPDRPFPIGLRLSRRAAEELSGEENERFVRWLRENDCFIPTLNGFPYGSFHGERIKERVYLPDWRSRERAAYTMRLADLLAGWLPAGVAGSISTVPIGFKGGVGERDRPEIRRQLLAVLTHLQSLRQNTGREIVLALEPEPGCLLETTEEICRFFADLDLPADLRDLLGVCYDCCHQAVEFEDPAASLARLAAAGIRIAKVQVSSALRLLAPTAAQLAPFDEPCYLHQVVARSPDGELSRYDDLPRALARLDPAAGEEWRCHFHVPIFVSGAGDYGTTRFFLEDILPLLPQELLLEVETYTWEVLPLELRLGSVTDSIIREIHWLEAQISATPSRS